MKPRLEILRNLLTDDGTIWISIDADECHYLKVLCDEIFGRNNFIDEVIWQRSYAPINLKKTLSRSHDVVLVYAKNKSSEFELNKLPRSEEANSRYKNPDNDPRGLWKSSDLSVGPAIQSNIYEITTPTGRKVLPPSGYSWRLSRDRFDEFVKDNRIWFGQDGGSVPSIKRFLTEVKDGVTAMTLWTYDEVGHTQDAKREVKAFNSLSVFDTPKPEKFIERILTLATNEGDWVLDSFLGSGTTAAVAHKMGRKWIGIEMGNHIYTHCKPRLDKVVDGSDQGGISVKKATYIFENSDIDTDILNVDDAKEFLKLMKKVSEVIDIDETTLKKIKSSLKTKKIVQDNWQGGGGYKFYELAPSLMVSNPKIPNIKQINPEYTFEMMCEAICKIEGFKYKPDGKFHGRSSEKRFIHISKEFVNGAYVNSILAELDEGESVLIYGTKIQSGLRLPDNVVVKKIPKDLLEKCTFESEVR